MFGNLDFSRTRSHSEAVGFFLLMTIMLVGFSSVLGGLLGLVGVDIGTGTSTVITGVGVHTMLSTLFVLIVSSLILTGKKLTGDLLSIILTIVGVYVTYTINVGLGMIVVAYLTTLKGH